MTIELDDKSYIVGMWFSSNPETNNDWLACVVRDPENPKRWKGWSRFRYTRDEKIWGSKDEKSWNHFTSEDDCPELLIINMMQLLQNSIQEGYPFKDKIIVKGSLKQLMELSKGKDWMNIKQVSQKEYDEHNAGL